VENDYLTIGEIADELRVTQPTIRNWIESGLLAAYRFGNTLRVERTEFVAFVERSRVQA
jgi:excisionase family DNA binding protein